MATTTTIPAVDPCTLALLQTHPHLNGVLDGGYTFLAKAVAHGDHALVSALLAAGADPAAGGTPALVLAARKGDALCVQVLLAAGAEVDRRNAKGRTGLMAASLKGSESCLRLFLDKGAGVGKAEANGFTSLMNACQNGHVACVRALIEAKAPVDAMEKHGQTALMTACMGGHHLCAEEVLMAGAAVDATNEDGCPALMFAAQSGHEECVHVLLVAGADVDKRGLDVTALMLACEGGHGELVRQLVQAGAVVSHAPNTSGWTAIRLARAHGYLSIATFLRTRQHWNAVAEAVRARPYVLHWMRTYSEAIFHPTSAAARCAAHVASGDKRSADAVRLQEENAQLKRLAVQLGATQERLALARAVAEHRTAGA